MRKRYTAQGDFIDAIEVGEDFVTVYIDSTVPGLPGSPQMQFVEDFRKYIENHSYHDPDRFHVGDHPRGDNWRTWGHKFKCHFHLLGDPRQILADLLNYNKLSSTLRKEIQDAETI